MNNTGTKIGSIQHIEEKNGECAAGLKYSVLIFAGKKIYIECNIWRVAVHPSYI
jgi:hypothetical protein